MTELLYLTNQDLYKTNATVLQIIEVESEVTNKCYNLVLNQTIFYVQGGGQPSDQGQISSSNAKFIVLKTVKNDAGQVLHFGYFVNGNFKIYENVDLEIDLEQRIRNSKIHSAGHLIDLAIQNLELNWVPTKGFHYPEGPYVEYQVQGETEPDLEDLRRQIQIQFNLLVEQNLPININLDKTKMVKDQVSREVSFDGLYATPCGGTHVYSTFELSGFEVTKIKLKSGVAKVSYKLL